MQRSGKLIRSPTLFVNTSHAMSMKPDPPTSAEQQQEQMPGAGRQPLLTTFSLSNRILKGSDGSAPAGRNSEPPPSAGDRSSLVQRPADGPHVVPMTGGGDDADASLAVSHPIYVLLIVCGYLLLDILLFGPLRYVWRVLSNVRRHGWGAFTLTDSRLAKAQPTLVHASTTTTTTTSKTATADAAALGGLQYVKYAEAAGGR